MKIESLVFLFALRALICTRTWHSCCSPASIVHFGCLWYSAPFLTGFRVIHHLRESFYIACFGLDTLEKINFLLHTHRHTAHTRNVCILCCFGFIFAILRLRKNFSLNFIVFIIFTHLVLHLSLLG